MNIPLSVYWYQEVGDARRIRNRILSNFELATQPSVTAEESERLLNVVIVGGGPTGVEFGAEVYDFVQQVGLAAATLKTRTFYFKYINSLLFLWLLIYFSL